MSLGKASIKRAAGAEKAASRKISGEKVAAESVISPMNAEEIQVKFLSGKNADKKPGEPVRITEDMPYYLL